MLAAQSSDRGKSLQLSVYPSFTITTSVTQCMHKVVAVNGKGELNITFPCAPNFRPCVSSVPSQTPSSSAATDL